MQINIANYEYPDVIDEDALIDIVRQLAEMAQTDVPPASPWQELTIHVLSDVSIALVHEAVNGVGGTTDVITQRYEPFPGEPAGLIGEIFVNLPCACVEGSKRQESRLCPARGAMQQQSGGRDQEAKKQWSIDRELALYIAHGCDHLNDHEDDSEAGYLSMRARELSWLQQLRLTPIVIKPII